MDTVQAAQFANDIGRFYQTLAGQVGDYLHQNIGTISTSQQSILSDDQTRLITYSNTFFSLSDTIAFAGADDYFQKVTNSTAQITDALNHMQTVDKIITISAGVITLAAGIVSQNGSTIIGSLQSIAQCIKG
jgi:hypothetical protein